MRNQYSATEQPNPSHNDKPAMWELVIEDTKNSFPDDAVRAAIVKDMTDRDTWGRTKYGTPLQPYNGRDALVDFYQELLDGVVYSAQYSWELAHSNDVLSDAHETVEKMYQGLLQAVFAVRRLILNRDNR